MLVRLSYPFKGRESACASDERGRGYPLYNPAEWDEGMKMIRYKLVGGVAVALLGMHECIGVRLRSN